MTPSLGIEPGPHWWEASALTTAPSLHPAIPGAREIVFERLTSSNVVTLQVLKTDKDKEEAKHEEEIADFLEKHGKELQDLESANNQKLMSEYEKYQELQAKSQKMQEDYERQLTEMEESKEQALEELTEYYENKLTEKSAQLEQVIPIRIGDEPSI